MSGSVFLSIEENTGQVSVENSVSLLEKLVAFDTVSHHANMALIEYIAETFGNLGIESRIIPNENATKANLLATVGPKDRGGVMLSGHTDVVPVDGQDWTKPAFEMTCQDGKYYGRGTTDMKGFVACAIHAAIKAQSRPLKSPLHLAFSYDEEIGCQGVRSMIDVLREAIPRPLMCIVGEPTSLAVATGHKGKVAIHARCLGQEGHSALAPFSLNALHLGTDLVQALRDVQQIVQKNFARDEDYDVPYTSVHVGRIHAGVALNIVPNLCEVDFEIRYLAEDNLRDILDLVTERVSRIVEKAKQQFGGAGIFLTESFSYPGLKTAANSEVVQFVKSLGGTNSTNKVAFGTEGGIFSTELSLPTVVCGPGSMEQGHKPDEYIEASQIALCDQMMDTLIDRLCAGL